MSTQYTPMEIKAARILCERIADACGVDRDDNWNIYSEDFKADAKAMLDACGALDLVAVLQELQESASYWSEYDVPIGIVDRINAAIAKATGAV